MADWTKSQNEKLGLACGMLGVQASGEQKKWWEAEKQLRAVLLLVKDNGTLHAETLFPLGPESYKPGEPKRDKVGVLDARRFNPQCTPSSSVTRRTRA